jgi:hypothetical protein
MRTHAFWLWLGPLVALAPLALAQCGGSDSAGVNKPDSAGGSGSGTSSGGSVSGSGGGSGSGGSAGSTSGSGDDSGPVDTGGGSGSSTGSSSGGDGSSGDGASSSGSPGCMSVDGGAQCSDPMKLPCGPATCDTSTQYCCVVNMGDAGRTETCVPPNGACSSTAKIGCKEAADCAGSTVCCGNFPMLGVQGVTSCMASCSAQQNVQICRTDAECGTNDAGVAKKCILQTCGSLTLQLCTAAFSPADAGGAYSGCTAK